MNHETKDESESFDALFELAREHRPEMTPRPGFETRLEARIRELREAGADSAAVLPLFTQWLWRTSWGLSPVVVLLTLFVVLMYGFDLPDGAGSVIFHLTEWLPGSGGF